jgi:acyl-CoA synthetase (AMP-forming)/AMP-acid ligase II
MWSSIPEATPAGLRDEAFIKIPISLAFLSGAGAVTEKELLEFAREHLADYNLPECITFIDALPKGATGKIDRKLLRQYDIS